MTFEEALIAASQLLNQRGQLLNSHLFRLVENDKQLFRAVRDQLVHQGIAEDRPGAGLVKSDRPNLVVNDDATRVPHETIGDSLISATMSELSSEECFDSSSSSDWVLTPEWWLMSSGKVRGPMSLVTLCQMRQHEELLLADVVRQGEQGLWQNPDEIPLLAASKPTPAPAKPVIEATAPKDAFVPIEKTWHLGDQARPNPLAHAWNVAAGIVGGAGRLKVLCSAMLAFGLLWYWWQLPPSASTIYREFAMCRTAFTRLQDRRVKRAEWEEAAARYRPRIQYILGRLRPRASSKYPLENALYQAGQQGVLQAIESPGGFSDPDPVFDKNMKLARDLLDGITP